MARQIVRKVLDRADFGRCVLLPKTEWSRVPAPGPVDIEVDEVPCTVMVAVEECDCRGTGVHEHRFVLLPDGVGGDEVRLGLPDR